MARRKVNPPDPNVIARVTHRKPKKPHEKRIAKDKDFHFQNHSFSSNPKSLGPSIPDTDPKKFFKTFGFRQFKNIIPLVQARVK